MQIVSSSLSQTPGQPSVLAKPGKDIAADAFAGLLAALAGVTAFLSQTVVPDPAAPTLAPADGVPRTPSTAGRPVPSGPQATASSPLGAGASPDPYGQTTGFLTFGPASSIQADSLAGSTQAAVREDGSVAGVPVSLSMPPGVAAAASPSADQEAAVPAGQGTQAMPASALIPGAAPATLLQGMPAAVAPVQSSGYLPEAGPAGYPPLTGGPGSGQGPNGPAMVPDPPAAQAAVVAAPPALSVQASNGAAVQAQPQASQAIPATGGYPPGVKVGEVVTGGVAAQGAQSPAVSGKVDAGPVSAQAATSGAQQQATPAGGDPQAGVTQGYPPEVGAAAATQAVLSPANSPNQGQAPPVTTAPSPAAQMVPGGVSGSQPQFAPDGGSSSSGGDGKGADPGKTSTNPLAGNPVPVLQAAPADPGTPVVSVASLPHETAQNILSYLNQGGRVPAQLQLQLDPPTLGKMTVHLAMEAGTLSVTFVTATSHAHDAVAASLPQMRELLSQNNFVLGHTGVYVGSQTGGSAGGNPRGEPYQGPYIRLSDPVTEGEEGIQAQAQSGSSLLNILV